MNILFFISSISLRKLVFYLKKKFKSLKKIYKWMKDCTKWWSIFTMVIQQNIKIIVFQSCIQLVVPNSINLINKFNLFACILFLFFAVFYAIAFYNLIYCYEKKKAASILLNYSFHERKSYYMESMIFLLRAITRGIIQGSAFQNY